MMLGHGYFITAEVTSVPNPKSWSNECVVTVADAGWHWEPLATSFTSTRQESQVVIYLLLGMQGDSEAALWMTEQPFSGMHCSPLSREGA